MYLYGAQIAGSDPELWDLVQELRCTATLDHSLSSACRPVAIGIIYFTPGGGMPVVQSGGKLANIVRALFNGTSNPLAEGSGKTMDAIRYELRTGQQVMGKWHLEKGFTSALGLDKWLAANSGAPAADRELARALLNELMDLFR